MKDDFENYCNQIENEYNSLGHELSWSFLCTSKETLKKNNSIALITMNPGGNVYTDPVKNYKEGKNVYLDEDWGEGNEKGKAPLQKQIQTLFQGLAKEIPKYKDGFETLMQESLVGYFIPFRSPDFASLEEPKKSLDFANNLWKDILSKTELKLIICIDKITFHYITKMYKDAFEYSVLKHKPKLKSGWGKIALEFTIFEKDKKQIVIARFPHLSRYKLFNREPSKENLNDFIKEITSAFK